MRVALKKLNLGINEKGEILENVSLEDELQSYTLSQDKISGKLLVHNCIINKLIIDFRAYFYIK